MIRRNLLKLGIGVILIILLVLVLLTTFNFQKDNINIYEDLTSEPEEEDTFSNSSDLEEQEIRLLVEEKRIILKNIIKNIQYYTLSEISKDYSTEDDQEYIGIDEQFLNELSIILTDELIYDLKEHLELVKIDNDVLLDATVYKCSKTVFDNLSYDSAIAFNEVNDEQLILKNASNDKISAVEKIKLCDEDNPDICQRESEYELVLEKENEEWQISEFGQKFN